MKLVKLVGLEHFSKSCSHIVISTAGRDLRLRDNQGVRISPCGRDDRIDKLSIVKKALSNFRLGKGQVNVKYHAAGKAAL